MENSNLKKLGIITAVVLLVIVMAFVIKQQYDALEARDAMLNKTLVEFRELKDGSVRAQAQYSKDLEAWAKQNKIDLGPIKDDIKSLDAKMIGISTLLASTPGYKGSSLPSTGTKPRTDTSTPEPVTVPCPSGGSVECPNLDQYGYLQNGQTLTLSEPLGNGKAIPFGEVEFRAWEPNPWSVEVLPRTYSVTTVIGQDEDGRHYTYHKFAVEANGTTHPVEIKDAKFVEEFPEANFHFSPRLYFGVDVGAQVYPIPNAEVAPNFQIALFSYGKMKVQPDWTFVGLGASYESQSQSMGVMLTPAAYNVGNHLPLVDNLYVGPSISVNTEGGVTVAGGIRVGL